jgi:hypothetical protein
VWRSRRHRLVATGSVKAANGFLCFRLRDERPGQKTTCDSADEFSSVH